jgi:hypothetical protein
LVVTAVDSVADISQVATQAARQGISRLLRTINPILWIVIGVSVLTIVGLIVYVMLSHTNTQALLGVFISLITAISGGLGIKWSGDTRTKSEQEVTDTIASAAQTNTKAIQEKKNGLQPDLGDVGTGLAGVVGGALGQAGNYLVDAYEKGLVRIQIELQSLNFSVAVAHPLVELVVRHYGVEGDLDFLNKVIWDNTSRQEQLQRVVTAAFGPISILLGSSGTKAETPATSQANAKTT